MTDKVLVYTTCATEEEAGRLARMAVERRLAACAAVTPGVRSVYHWKGQVETAGEWQVVFKSTQQLFGELEGAIREAHSYEVPEILAVPVTAGSTAYLWWMDEELRR
jgi:periplasmic divalent cation tolerance protein